MVLAAGDTFRAAAAEQLEEWARRAGADLVRAENEKQRPGVVLYNVRSAAKRAGAVPVAMGEPAGLAGASAGVLDWVASCA